MLLPRQHKLFPRHTTPTYPQTCLNSQALQQQSVPDKSPAALPLSCLQLLTEAVHRGDVAAVQRLLDTGTGLLPVRPLPSSLNPLVIEATCCGQRWVGRRVFAEHHGKLWSTIQRGLGNQPHGLAVPM